MSLPNLLLALLPHFPPEALHDPTEEDPAVEDVLPDITQPGVLPITPAVKSTFKRLLHENNVELRFTYGAWGGLAKDLREREGGDETDKRRRAYDLVLTSETIYAEDSVDDLIAVLRSATATANGDDKATAKATANLHKVEVSLEEGLGELQLDRWKCEALTSGEGVVLVAAKVGSRVLTARTLQ